MSTLGRSSSIRAKDPLLRGKEPGTDLLNGSSSTSSNNDNSSSNGPGGPGGATGGGGAAGKGQQVGSKLVNNNFLDRSYCKEYVAVLSV